MLSFKKICLLLFTLNLVFNSVAQIQIPKCGIKDDIKRVSRLSKQARRSVENIPDTTTIYTIPVVFIVYHLGEAEGVGNNISKTTIDETLEKLNDWYIAKSTSEQRNGFDTIIQFAYAQKTPNCQPINGIIRVNASGVPDYVNNVSVFGNQVLEDTLRLLTPEYGSNTEHGIIIRVVKSVAPWAGYAWYFGDTFIGSNYLNYDNLAPHEVGHVLGLYHTFEGSNQGQCPQNFDPNLNGDQIADTDPHLESDNGCYRSLDINKCTGQPFGALLKNTMSYSYCTDRFTKGQANKMRYYMVNNYFGNMLNPELLVPISAENAIKPFTCPITIGQKVATYFYKVSGFELNTISKYSEFLTTIPNAFYVNNTCVNRTTITANMNYEVTISGAVYSNFYIDYNDDGQFNETNELILKNVRNGSFPISISDNSIKNKYLRARVVSSNLNTHTSCNLPSNNTENYGEIEDYGIKIISNSTCTSMQTVKTGNWNDPSVWSCNYVPTLIENVTIIPYHTITIPKDYLAYAKDVSIKGVLKFELNSKLFCR